MRNMNTPIIGIIGLGYVGLPLAVAFAKHFRVLGYDINSERVDELNLYSDSTQEVSKSELKNSIIPSSSKIEKVRSGLQITSDKSLLEQCSIYIITVPTPIDEFKNPDLKPLIGASTLVGEYLSGGNYVIYESTVYPGATEEVCVPILEKCSDLKLNQGFYVGYSPERINPGDKERTVTKILKVTSGSSPEAAEVIDGLYKEVITAGTHLAPTIKVAEAAKVIENSQRDINIAFVNELAKIFNKLEIDTHSVLEAAGTKWNFLPFKPGLVGGHCIGVDPYYLAQKAQEVGYHPEIILSGRRLNDDMGKYIAGEVIKLMIRRSLPILKSNALILGITFKENCPDIRNTRVIDVIEELRTYNVNVDVFDPWADAEEVRSELNIDLVETIENKYHAVILTVAHKQFFHTDWSNWLLPRGVIYDVKGYLPGDIIDKRL